MKSDNLGSKKINNKQNPSEELNPENLSDTNNIEKKLISEVETDSNGNKKIVHRARNIDAGPEQKNTKTTSSGAEILSEDQTKKMIENKDLNSDITANRYPNSHPDNHENRGNIKLDE